MPMSQHIRRRQDGFTLVELMVIVLIIAILIAIAIPTFMGSARRAQDRAAQTYIRHALTAELTVYTDNEVFTASSATLASAESRLNYVSGIPTKGAAEVYVAVNATSDVVVMGAQSGSGHCFWAREGVPGGSAGLRWNTSTDCSAPPAADDAGFTLPAAPPPG